MISERGLKRLSPPTQFRNEKNKYEYIIFKSRGVFQSYLYIFIFDSRDG